MITSSDLLISAIEEHRPIVLVLGQDAWAESEKDGDPILKAALRKLGRDSKVRHRRWSALLDSTPVPPEFYEWLSERFRRRVHPSSLEILSELPWSAVFTSALDPTVSGLFQRRGSEPQVILTASETPLVVRSRARPPFYYLFSRSSEQDPQAYPPASRRELNSRRIHHAIPLLNRVLDTATTLGLVIVDGFGSGQDWFRMEDLLGIIGNANPAQILWCGGPPQNMGNSVEDEFGEAVESERILVESRRLGTLIAELRAQDKLPNIGIPDSEDVGIISLRDGRRIETTPEERLRVEAVTSIVDDSWTTFPTPLGKDTEYATFRRFHGALEGPRLLVEGIRRDFAIERDFERELLHRVSTAIAEHTSINTPIIVEGQSGTGKSVALARIVARVREGKLAPVLYSIGRIPRSEEVFSFCENSEKSNARATLIVCDANKDVDQYHDLLIGLRSRGRRVVVLGSQYRIAENSNNNGSYVNIQAPTLLSDVERDRLATLLERYFDRPDTSQLKDHHILTFLYRLLPASRQRIGSGLSDEARAAEFELRRAGRQINPVIPITQLHQQLIEKGFIDNYRPIFSDDQTNILDIDSEDTAGRIINLVMAAGSLNCAIPVNLLLRSVTQDSPGSDLSLISDLFRRLDLFRWKESDTEGSDIHILPRLMLEAQLISRLRLGGPQGEVTCLLDLISAVRSGIDRLHEIRFLLDILQQIGTDGPRGQRYRNSYVEIARTLTKLRKQYGVIDPRLILQESAFRRSAVRCNTVEDDDVLPLLEEARDSIQMALDGIADGSVWAPRRTEQNLRVELAALYGFLANNLVNSERPLEEIRSFYESARTAVHRAVSADDSYYPLDIGLWMPADLLKSDRLIESDSLRAELAADIYSTLDQVEPDSLPPNQRERFYSRQLNVGNVLQDHRLSDQAYFELEASGSTAGYFLRARQYVSQLSRDDNEFNSIEDRRSAKKAAEFLQDRFNRIENDQRCLSLLLECHWIAEMGRRPLRGERGPIPSVDSDRRDILRIVTTLNHASGEASRHVSKYLEAVLTWLIYDEEYAIQIFRDIEQETDYEFSGRVIRRHIVTRPDGSPCLFEGRIEGERGEGRWIVRVDDLNRKINLLSRDFPSEDIAYGRTIKDFGVAFNFIGPIADPIIRWRG